MILRKFGVDSVQRWDVAPAWQGLYAWASVTILIKVAWRFVTQTQARVLKGHSDLTGVCRLGHNAHFPRTYVKHTFHCHFALKINKLALTAFWGNLVQNESSLKKPMLKPSESTCILIKCLNHRKRLLLNQSSSGSLSSLQDGAAHLVAKAEPGHST